MNNIYTGTSGLVLPFPKKLFPEPYRDYSRLAYYATLYNSIEVNSSFYKMPRAITIARWKNEVPGHFRFSFKLLKDISHVKGLIYDPLILEQFLENIESAGDKKGCLLIQFPPKLTIALSQLKKLLTICKKSGWKLAVEFRNHSWYIEDVYQLLNKFNAAMVIHDFPASAPPHISTADFIYIRFHGAGSLFRGSYETALLDEYANYVKESGKEAYVYFNNSMGEPVGNLNTLNTLLNR